MTEPVAATSPATLRRKLGRGLGSLISSPVRIEMPEPSTDANHLAEGAQDRASAAGRAVIGSHDAPATSQAEISSIPLHQIHPNPKQPRQHFDEEALRLLATSISNSGLMQPIVVRPSTTMNGGKGGFQIIAGERRWRAAQLAGLQRIPVVVRNVDDRTAAELSLVENLQREDLNPMERAEAFARLIDEFGLTHQDIAQQVGLDRSSVTNHLRLHELDPATKDAVRAGLLSMGHAKALLAITNDKQRVALAGQAVRQDWSVRELEKQVKARLSGRGPAAGAASTNAKSPTAANAADLERRLSEHLGSKVRLHTGRQKGTGRLVIEFYTLDQFEGILRRLQFEGD